MPFNDLEKFATVFFDKCTLGKIIGKYIVLHEGDKCLMVLRPYQFYAVEKILDRVENSNDNGYIWHTTGAGKTLTSFKAAQLVSELDDVDKVMFVVDRHDLDTQTQAEYEAFEPGAVDSTDNTDELVKRLHSNSKIIITTIQKLNAAVSKQWYSSRIEEIRHSRIVMIFDEYEWGCLERSQGLSCTSCMPDITIVIGVFHTVENLLHCIELVRAKHHQTFVTLMQYYVLTYNLAQRALVEEHCGKLLQVVERHVCGIRPVECELEAAIRIVGEIASVHTIRYDKQLDVIKQAMKRSFVITLYLVVCLFQFHASTLQFYLDQRQTVDKYRHIVTTLFSALNRNLIGNLELVLTPVSAVQELHP